MQSLAASDKARDRHLFDVELLLKLAERAEINDKQLAEQREALEKCLQKLPDRKRRLVLLAYAPSANIKRLAESLGRTPMSLYKSLHQIRLILLSCTRRALSKEGVI
jgi:RNA polymerase sigma-70 factor, ECF subfamily